MFITFVLLSSARRLRLVGGYSWLEGGVFIFVRGDLVRATGMVSGHYTPGAVAAG